MKNGDNNEFGFIKNNFPTENDARPRDPVIPNCNSQLSRLTYLVPATYSCLYGSFWWHFPSHLIPTTLSEIFAAVDSTCSLDLGDLCFLWVFREMFLQR